MNKHAYLIIAHSNIDQLKILIQLIDDERNDIYLMFDKKNKSLSDIDISTNHSKIFFVKQVNIFWGEYSGIEAELRLFKEASKKKYVYYHLISGQDLPIASQNVIHNFFDNNYGKQFISFQPSNIEEVKDKVKPHLLRKFYNDGVRNKSSKLNLFFRISISMYRRMESFLLRFLFNGRNYNKFKTGSNWVSITHPLVEFIINNEDLIYKLFRRGKVIDELFIQTVVYTNSYFIKQISDSKEYDYSPNNHLGNLRYIVKGYNEPHPKVFKSQDFNELKKASEDGYLFARKFDIKTDKQIIEKVYTMLKKGKDNLW